MQFIFVNIIYLLYNKYKFYNNVMTVGNNPLSLQFKLV